MLTLDFSFVISVLDSAFGVPVFLHFGFSILVFACFAVNYAREQLDQVLLGTRELAFKDSYYFYTHPPLPVPFHPAAETNSLNIVNRGEWL